MDLLNTLQGPLAGRYRLERELGRGGMAVVYLADDLKHGRRVAIKVLRSELAASLGSERFLREITLSAGLQHPHILPLYDSGSEAVGSNTVLYYVMPYVEGETLRDRLLSEGQLPVDAAVSIAREVLDALGAAHARGVVHRDVKPENILLSGGHALVADFGIARAVGVAGGERLTDIGLAIGTPAYMSPEQASAEREVDARSDLYSLGCVLYEMLTGEPPFTGPNAQAILVKRLTDPVPSARRLRDTISVELDAALHRALAKAPTDRFATAAEFSGALQTGTTPTSTPAPVGTPRRSRWPLLAALAAVAAVVAVVVWARRSPPAADAARRLALTDFVVTNRDSSTDYLRSGIPDYLVSALRILPGLDVMPMSLVRRDSAITSPVDLGRKLGATAVLTGTLARFGGRLSVNSELIQVSDGRLLWSGQFEYPDTDYAGLVPAVVGAIADSLRLQLSGGVRQDVIERATVDPVVLDLLLRGRRWWYRGAAGAPGRLRHHRLGTHVLPACAGSFAQESPGHRGHGRLLLHFLHPGVGSAGTHPGRDAYPGGFPDPPGAHARQHHRDLLERDLDLTPLPGGRFRGCAHGQPTDVDPGLRVSPRRFASAAFSVRKSTGTSRARCRTTSGASNSIPTCST